MILQKINFIKISLLLSVVILSAYIITNTAFASDKYSGGSTSGGGSGYTSCGSGCSTGYTSSRQSETIRYSDYNRDGDLRDPNEVTSSISRDGGSDTYTPAPCTRPPNLQVTDILFVVPGTILTRSNAPAGFDRINILGGARMGSIGVDQNNLTLGAQYEPVVEITNSGCTGTAYDRTTVTSQSGRNDSSSGASPRVTGQNTAPGSGFIDSVMTSIQTWGSSLRGRLGGQLGLSGSDFGGRVPSVGNPATFHIDQLPFGENGTFPVRLRVDFLNDSSYEITEFINNQGVVPAGGRIYVRFSAITAQGGVHGIASTVDVTEAEAPGQACRGAEGCIVERGNPTTNTRTETFAVIVPSVLIGSYLLSGPVSNITSTNRWWTVTYSTADKRFTDRDLATDLRWNRQQRTGFNTGFSNVGLYWEGGRGTSINASTCTGRSVQNNGSALSDFNGQSDIPTIRPTGDYDYNGGMSIIGFSRSERKLDLQIIEPVASTSHTYTVTCQTTAGVTVSDSIVISNGLGGNITPASLPNLRAESVDVSGRILVMAGVQLRNTGVDLPTGTRFSTSYTLTGLLPSSLNRTVAFTSTLSAPWLTNQILSIPSRSLGVSDSDQNRVCITANNLRSVTESDYSDNTICSTSGSSTLTPPRMTLEARGNVVRYNETATLRYLIDAPYILNCTLTGPGLSQSFVHSGGVTENTVTTQRLQNKQQFVLTCTPDPALGTTFGPQSRQIQIEIIPQVQEV